MYNAKLKYKYILCLLLLIACEDDHTNLRKAIDALDAHQLTTGSYVIIPNQGCEGCISTAEAFVKKHVDRSDNIRYIFTRIASVKLLRIKLGSHVMSSSKILLDTTDMIEYPDKGKQIYPMIVTLKDHEIDKVTYQSPDDDGLDALLRK
jgi:hypothetical protein